MFVNTQTQATADAGEIRRAHPEISFPPEITIDHVAELGYAELEYDAEPELVAGEYLQPGDIREEGERYVQSWVVVPAPEPETPQSVTMRQARLAMLGAGILDDVEAMISGMEGDEGRAAKIDWEYAMDVRRDWPLVAALGSQLSMTDEQIDELFIAAAAIPQ